VRRKIRRITEAGRVEFHVADNKSAIDEAFERFLTLFRISRQDKAEFLTPRMKMYFLGLAKAMAERNLLRLGFLNINGRSAAGTFCFQYQNTMFLYNNGYDPAYRRLSPGFLCKVFSIRHAIENRNAVYNFLKGDEPYKKRMGGRAVDLFRVTVEL
jgi:CelD/BcsL family acetyltransferase involved in cellulose biosynthesis